MAHQDISRSPEQQKQDALLAELAQIQSEFESVIAQKGHCYQRGADESQECDCVDFYQRWVETKKRYAE